MKDNLDTDLHTSSPRFEQQETSMETSLAVVEERLDRLERAVAEMQNTDVMQNWLEERLRTLLRDRGDLLVASDGERHLPARRDDTIMVEVHEPPSESYWNWRSWMLFEFVMDLRDFFVMQWDSRYRMTRTAQFLIPILFAYIVLSWFVLPSFFLLSHLVELLVAFFLFKVLSREVGRYRSHLVRLGHRYQ